MITRDWKESHEAERRDSGEGVNMIIPSLDLTVKDGHGENIKSRT